MAKVVEFTWTVPLSMDDLTKELKLSVSTADPQTITSTVRKPDGKLVNGTIQNVSLGKNLKGKQASCNSLVTDFDSNSNETQVTFKVGPYSITYNEKVEKDGGSIIYKVKIKFV